MGIKSFTTFGPEKFRPYLQINVDRHSNLFGSSIDDEEKGFVTLTPVLPVSLEPKFFCLNLSKGTKRNEMPTPTQNPISPNSTQNFHLI
jgi:hypothetical protein